MGDAASIPDTGTPDASEADGAAGSLCRVGSVQESEVNDTPGAADTISGEGGTFCGTVSSSDSDYVSFTLPVDASSLNIAADASANLTLEGTVDGQNFTLAGPGASPTFPFKAGSTYTLHARTNAAKSDYLIAVTVEHAAASSKCEADSVKEVEDNGTTPQSIASTHSFSYCGTINTATDNDKFTFTLDAAVTNFSYLYSTTGGNFTLECTVDGKSYTLTNPNPNMPLKTGMPYVCTASSSTVNNGYIFKLTTTP